MSVLGGKFLVIFRTILGTFQNSEPWNHILDTPGHLFWHCTMVYPDLVTAFEKFTPSPPFLTSCQLWKMKRPFKDIWGRFRKVYSSLAQRSLQNPGFCAFLSPCLALFFNQTTTTRNLNFFYKWNILFTNLLFGFIFLGLVIQINTHEQKGIWKVSHFFLQFYRFADKTGTGQNFVRRNVVFSCKEKDLDYTQFEFSLPWGTPHINTTCFHETQFLGGKWESRVSPQDEKVFFPTDLIIMFPFSTDLSNHLEIQTMWKLDRWPTHGTRRSRPLSCQSTL